MTYRQRLVRSLRLPALMVWAVAAGIFAAPVYSQHSSETQTTVSVNEISERLWTSSRDRSIERAFELLRSVPTDVSDRRLASLRASFDRLERSIEQREELRRTKIGEAWESLAEHLAEAESPRSLSSALKAAVELHDLSTEPDEVLGDEQIQGLVRKAEATARRAESDGHWLMANELFYRLNVLLEDDGRYRPDVQRLNRRLSMIRLYVPRRFWELRNEHRMAEGNDPLPAYNPMGDGYRSRLSGIRPEIVTLAVSRAADRHINRDSIGVGDLLAGGLENVRTMLTTSDLAPEFPGIENDREVRRMLDHIDRAARELRDGPRRLLTMRDIRDVVQELLETNSRSTRIPETALLHEFGDGAMAVLDEYSGIIWPDELRRFERMTQGRFHGVGIQIQVDEESQYIKVITPLEGTPAQRAGVRAGDLIKKIDGRSAVGITLDQAVDLITGPPNTRVRLTMEREGDDLDFELVRDLIPLQSIKGWRRAGPREDEWDWFIDKENRIGYIRLLNFTEDTTRDLEQAISSMQRDDSLNGLILDLRFNPGGLLDQAVSVANLFIQRGTIVSTEGTMPRQVEIARRDKARIQGVPLVVLINHGSASASEIVSGAIKHYADRGDLDAIVVGQRTYGKGSVQNVWPLGPTNAMLKLTTQYYKLPDGQIIHREPGSRVWGVSPHADWEIEMLPEQISKALTLRQEADVLPLDERGRIIELDEPPVDPDLLLTDGLDLQLQHALFLLQSRALAEAGPHRHAMQD